MWPVRLVVVMLRVPGRPKLCEPITFMALLPAASRPCTAVVDSPMTGRDGAGGGSAPCRVEGRWPC